MRDRFIAYPLDGYESGEIVLEEARKILSTPGIGELIKVLKINDAVHVPDIPGPKMVELLRETAIDLGLDVGVFLDLKVNDVAGTLKNLTRHYASVEPAVLTVSSNTSALGFLELRRGLPNAKLALFCLPTDISEDECLRRYNLSPLDKISKDAWGIMGTYERRSDPGDNPKPFDMIVSSPKELPFLKTVFGPYGYGFVVPGIRDKWMAKHHQERTTGIREALEFGALIAVMGAQLRDGNPKMGITPEKSREMTLAEINKVGSWESRS